MIYYIKIKLYLYCSLISSEKSQLILKNLKQVHQFDLSSESEIKLSLINCYCIIIIL